VVDVLKGDYLIKLAKEKNKKEEKDNKAKK